jgi:putative transcriptional regulator
MAIVRARREADGRLINVRTGEEMRSDIDWDRVNALTEEDIERHAAEDDAEALRDAAAHIRRIRRRTSLSQVIFAHRIGVSVETLRNWEQGKRSPAGPARALLRILDHSPEMALIALR